MNYTRYLFSLIFVIIIGLPTTKSHNISCDKHQITDIENIFQKFSTIFEHAPDERIAIIDTLIVSLDLLYNHAKPEYNALHELLQVNIYTNLTTLYFYELQHSISSQDLVHICTTLKALNALPKLKFPTLVALLEFYKFKIAPHTIAHKKQTYTKLLALFKTYLDEFCTTEPACSYQNVAQALSIIIWHLKPYDPSFFMHPTFMQQLYDISNIASKIAITVGIFVLVYGAYTANKTLQLQKTNLIATIEASIQSFTHSIEHFLNGDKGIAQSVDQVAEACNGPNGLTQTTQEVAQKFKKLITTLEKRANEPFVTVLTQSKK